MKKIELESVRPSDYAGVAAFLIEQKASDLTKEQWQEKFRTFWDLNPFFREDSHERGWLLRDETGTVCGFLGSIPVQYVRSGQEEIGFALTTWFVHPDARKHSLALYGCFMEQKGVLLNTTPTPEVEELLKGVFKFIPLTADWIKRDYFFPVRKVAFSRYLKERFRLNPLLKKASSAEAYFAWELSNRLAPGKGKGDFIIDVREVNEPPSDTKQWWDAFKKLHSFTLARNFEGLRYFFFSGEFLKTRKVLEVRCQGELLGFLAARLICRSEYSYVEVIDLALVEDDVSIYLVLIEKLKALARVWKPDTAYIKTNAFSNRMKDALKKSGFWSVAGRSRFYFFDHQGNIQPDEFYGTLLDGDRVCL